MNAIGYGEGNANGDGQCLHGVFYAVCLSDRQVRVDPSIKKYGRTAEPPGTTGHVGSGCFFFWREERVLKCSLLF